MQRLNFPAYKFRIKNSENKTAIFDPIRKKFVLLTPEEWVRQHTVAYLMIEKKYPKSLISIEKTILINQSKKRYDIVIFNPNGSILLIIECKRASIPITQASFDQIARYNLALNATYLMVTNGLNHYYCQLNYEQKRYDFLKSIPAYQTK